MIRLTEKASDFKIYGHYQCNGNAIDKLGPLEDKCPFCEQEVTEND